MVAGARTYLFGFATAALVSIAALVTLNLLVDPYDLFGTPKIKGFNAVKAVIGSKQRVYETVEMLRRRPQVLILGTSRTDIGMAPDHPALPAGGGFNAAMSGQQIWESRRLLEELLARPDHKPQIVVIGLDFFAFNVLVPTPFDYSEDNFRPLRRVELAFSITTALDAARTLIRQNREVQLAQGGLLRDDGFRDYVGNPRLSAPERFRGSEDGYLRYTYKPAPGCAWRTTRAKDGSDTYEDFRRLLALAYQHQIDLRLFISPSHARQWETLAASGLWGQFEDWKRRLVALNHEEAQRFKQPEYQLWDFSGYNSITTEPVLKEDEQDVTNYWESSHYRKEVGDMVLDRMFRYRDANRNLPDDFGVALTQSNIEVILEDVRSRQRKYRQDQPAEAEDVMRIATVVARQGPCALNR